MDRPGFESQHSPTFCLFSKCPEPLPDHAVFSSIGTGRYNRGQNGWDVMLTTNLYIKFSKRRDSNQLTEKIVQLAKQPALGVDMCDVEEITDLRGEELTDKMSFNWKEVNCLQNLKLRYWKNHKSSQNYSQRCERS